MNELAQRAIPESEEIREKRVEVTKLSNRLALREQELAEVRIAMARFEGRYYRTVGRRYVELDRLEAEIAQKHFSQSPHNEGLRWQAYRTSRRAERSSQDYRDWQAAPDPPGEGIPPPKANKKLFREIAARIHPDRAEDERSRPLRTQLMAELNAAYARGDADGMRQVLKTWQESPEAVAGSGPEADLVRLNRLSQRLQRQIAHLEGQLRRLRSTEIFHIMQKTQEAERNGRDVLAELVEKLDRKIELARRELDRLSSRGGQ